MGVVLGAGNFTSKKTKSLDLIEVTRSQGWVDNGQTSTPVTRFLVSATWWLAAPFTKMKKPGNYQIEEVRDQSFLLDILSR